MRENYEYARGYRAGLNDALVALMANDGDHAAARRVVSAMLDRAEAELEAESEMMDDHG